MKVIPYGRQDITPEDIEAVVDVLRSDFLTQGPSVEGFESCLASYCGAKHAVAVNSATSALHLACLALDVGPGDIVWTSPITFVASANSALYCGASVDFVDIDYTTNNISVAALKQKLEIARATDRLPTVLIPVHMAGASCDMVSIFQLSQEYGFRIIEDASHAIGGTYVGRKVGAGFYSDITVFSFHPVKIITTGEGGAALTNSEVLKQRLLLLRSHGITRDAQQMSGVPDGGWYYQQIELGFNYRLTDIQAALGVSQLLRTDLYVAERNRIAEQYNQGLARLPVSLPQDLADVYSSFHLYIIKLADGAPVSRKCLYDGLRDQNIGVNVHYIPVHLQPYYRRLGFSKGDFPEAERYYDRAISLPLHPNLAPAEQEYIIAKVSELLA